MTPQKVDFSLQEEELIAAAVALTCFFKPF